MLLNTNGAMIEPDCPSVTSEEAKTVHMQISRMFFLFRCDLVASSGSPLRSGFTFIQLSPVN